MIGEADKDNFETIKEACGNGHLTLMEATRKSDGKMVALVCAVGRDDEDFIMTPLAVMVEGNPFEDFEPPEGVKG